MKPKLIHKVPVEIQNQNPDTEYDSYYKESKPGQKVYDPIIIKFDAQIHIFEYDKVEGGASGFQLVGNGYLLVYKEDSEKVKLNSKIILIDKEAVEYYIMEMPPAAFYTTSTLRKLMFITKERFKQ